MSEARSSSLFARARPLMLARLASAGMSFVIPLVLARLFAQEEYGTYKQLFLVSQTLWLILPFGMAQSLYYFLPRLQAGRAYVLQTLLFLTLVGGAAGFGVVYLRDDIGRWLNNPEMAQYAAPLAAYLFGLVVSLPLEVGLTARGKTGQAAAVYIVSDLVKSLAMTLPALFGFGLRGVMLGIAAFALARLVATWHLLLKDATGPLFDREALVSQLKYALPFGAAMALAIPQQYFHQYVVSAKLDAATFAIYAVGIFQLPVIDLLYTPTSEVLMVRLAELEREGRAYEGVFAFREGAQKLGYFFVPMTVFLVAIAPEFITALFTTRYIAAVPIFQIVALDILLAILPVDGALRARNETRFIFFSYAVKAAVTVPLVLVGVSKFGMLGAVGSWLVADLIGKATLIARLPKALGVTFRATIPWTELGRAAGASLLACGGVFLARTLTAGHHAFVTCAAAGTLFGVGYVAALWALGMRLPTLPGMFRTRPVRVPTDGHTP